MSPRGKMPVAETASAKVAVSFLRFPSAPTPQDDGFLGL